MKSYYKATIVINVWYQHQDKHLNQWNKIESSKVLQIYGKLIFNKGVRALSGEMLVFSKNGFGTMEYPYGKNNYHGSISHTLFKT